MLGVGCCLRLPSLTESVKVAELVVVMAISGEVFTVTCGVGIVVVVFNEGDVTVIVVVCDVG